MKSTKSVKEFYDDGYKKPTFEAYPSPSETYCWHKMKNTILKFLKNELKKMNGADVYLLDLGCGNGKDIFNFNIACKADKKIHFFGMDISPAAILHAKTIAEDSGFDNMEFFVGDVENKESWPKKLKDVKFNIITSSEVLEHLENPEKFIKTIASSLAPNGCLILSSPNKKYLLKEVYRALPDSFQAKYKDIHNKRFGTIPHEIGHISVCSYKEIRKLLEENGLKVEKAVRGAPFYGGASADKNRLMLCSYIFLDMLLPNQPYYGWEFVVKARKMNI